VIHSARLSYLLTRNGKSVADRKSPLMRSDHRVGGHGTSCPWVHFQRLFITGGGLDIGFIDPYRLAAGSVDRISRARRADPPCRMRDQSQDRQRAQTASGRGDRFLLAPSSYWRAGDCLLASAQQISRFIGSSDRPVRAIPAELSRPDVAPPTS
jgi:hypothetical protein